MENEQTRRASRRRLRAAVVATLLLIGVAGFTSSAVGWWARRNVTNTEVWLDRVGPLAEDPAVRAALGAWVSNQIIDLVNPAAVFEEVLPQRGQILAVPLSNAVEDFLRERVDRFLASDLFERLWLAANERAHRATIKLLRGESDVAEARNGKVVINLVPMLNAVLADIGKASPELLGRQVDLPDLSLDELPPAAIARVERALGVNLDDDFGQFVVYDHGRLRALQDAADQARRGLVLVSVITVVTLGAALVLSDRKRRTLLQMLAGLAIALALIRRLGLRGQRELLAAIPDQVNRAAAEAASDQFLDPLLAVTQTLLIVLALVSLAAVLSGPYPWAARFRSRVVDLIRSLRPEEGGREWLNTHRSRLQIGGVAAAVFVLLVADLSFVGLAVLGLLVVLGEVALRTSASTSE
ncbi:MAG TPA: hypothetical protein VGJ86_17500 [Acidimicrobiales bacterium]|jgi:hypothetical protein